MTFLPFLGFLLSFFLLLAASSALTYLSVRSWVRSRMERDSNRVWRVSPWSHALRTCGFFLLTLGSLVGAVYDPDLTIGRIDMLSCTRILGDLLILFSTPRRLRSRPLFGLAVMLLLLGEAMVVLRTQGIGASLPVPGTNVPLLSVLSILAMDCGIAVLWNRFTRTILRIRLTDRFALAFSVFSVFLVLLVTLCILVVLQTNLIDLLGLTPGQIAPASAALNRILIILFICVVAASAIISVFLAQSLIAPVNRMNIALQAIGKGEWTTRLRGIRSRDEIQDLAHEINTMATRLKEAEELRLEFVSFVSHELRNPLTTVKGFAETLRAVDQPEATGISPEERAEIYLIVCEECDRLLRMTNELLDTSRVEAGKPVTLNAQNFDLVHLARRVTLIMSKLSDRHDIEVTPNQSTIPLEADPDKIEQILINLLSNAIKYSPDGGAVTVSLRDGASKVEVEVRDSGVGMSVDQAARVFDKFYRIQDSSVGTAHQNTTQGSGIGLYLTRALVNAHGGTIRVESTEGKGSVFSVTLPKLQRLTVSESVSREPSPLLPATML